MKRVVLISLALFLLFPRIAFAGYTIEGNTVKWENQYGSLEVSPHTCNDLICTQYAEIASKINQDMDLNFSFIFPEPIKGKLWLWENYSHTIKVPYEDICTSSVECSNIINETMCEVYDEAIFGEPFNQTCDYIENDICYWDYTCIKYFEEEQWFYDWKDRTNLINHLEYQNKHYYYMLDVPFKALDSKQVKWEYQTPIIKTPIGFGSSGKWEMYIWRGDYNNPTESVLLDPWWSSLWLNRKQHNITGSSFGTGNQTDYQVRINITNTSGTDSGDTVYITKARSDLGDVRFTYYNSTDDTETLMDYWLKETGSNYGIFWVEVPFVTNETNNTIYIYYNKSDATTISDIDDTFVFGDEFNTLDSDKWINNTVDAGTSISIEDGQLKFIVKSGYSHTGGCVVYADTIPAGDYAVQTKVKFTDYFTSAFGAYVGFTDTSTSFGGYYGNPNTYAAARLWDYTTLGRYLVVEENDLGQKWGTTSITIRNLWFKMQTIYLYTPATQNITGVWEQLESPYATGMLNKTGTGGLVPIKPMLGIGEYNKNENTTFEYVFVRKYASPEPSHSDWGSEETAVDVAPIYSNNATNETVVSNPCNFTLDWDDGYGLSGYIFSTNNSGTWQNASFISFSGTSNSSWNVTTLNDTAETVVGWCYYANDTSDNWNGTSCDTPFTLTTIPVTYNYTYDLRVADVDDNPINNADVDINSTVAEAYCSNHKITTNSTGQIATVNISEGECNPYIFKIEATGYESLNFTANITTNTSWHLPMSPPSPTTAPQTETVYCVWHRVIKVGRKTYILCVDQNARTKLFLLSGLSVFIIPIIKRKKKRI